MEDRIQPLPLDPAKLTRDREGVEVALKKYTDMNRLALQVVRPGGVLLTCSCTGLVGEPEFLDVLRRAAWQAVQLCCFPRRSAINLDDCSFCGLTFEVDL